MSQYPNWFEMGAQKYFDKYLRRFIGTKASFLQIGAYTGDASAWMLEHILDHPLSNLTDVDTWQGSEEAVHKSFDWQDVEEVYDSKTHSYAAADKLLKYKGTSDDFFSASGFLNRKYDFIYVDGDHTALGVLKDGLNALQVVAPGGLVAFDDYTWRSGKGPTHDPYPAVDALIVAFGDKFELIDKGLQVWLRNVE